MPRHNRAAPSRVTSPIGQSPPDKVTHVSWSRFSHQVHHCPHFGKLAGLRCVAFALAKLLETHCSYPHPYRSHRVIADDQISSSNNFPPLVNLLSSCDNLHQPPLAACHSPRHWQPLLPPLASRSSQAGSRNMVNSSVLRVTFAK